MEFIDTEEADDENDAEHRAQGRLPPFVGDQYCEECEEDTPHKHEDLGSVGNGGGFPHQDDHEWHITCQKCSKSIRQI